MGTSSTVATARSVTPAQATSACSSMSPEHTRLPSPAGRLVQPGPDELGVGAYRARHAGAELPFGPQRHQRARGVGAVTSFNGACSARSESRSVIARPYPGGSARRYAAGTASAIQTPRPAS